MATDFTITKRVKVTSIKATRACHQRPNTKLYDYALKRKATMCGLCKRHPVVGGDVRCKFCIESHER